MAGKHLCNLLVFLSLLTSLVLSELSAEVQEPCALFHMSNAGVGGMSLHCGILTPWHDMGLFLFHCID